MSKFELTKPRYIEKSEIEAGVTKKNSIKFPEILEEKISIGNSSTVNIAQLSLEKLSEIIEKGSEVKSKNLMPSTKKEVDLIIKAAEKQILIYIREKIQMPGLKEEKKEALGRIDSLRGF